MTASGTAQRGLGFSQDVFAAPLLCPLRQDMEEGAEGDGECVEETTATPGMSATRSDTAC